MNNLFLSLTGLIHLAAVSLVLAQAPAVPGPAQGRPAGMTNEIEELLKSMLAAYREAGTYQDKGHVELSRITGRVVEITRMPSSIILSRPNRIQQIGGGQLVTSDGQTLQIVLDGMGQYTSAPAPKDLKYEHIAVAAMGGGIDQGYPDVAEFLLDENIYPRWTHQIRQIELEEEVKELAGRKCRVIRYATLYRARVDLYLDSESGVLLRCLMDLTDAQDPVGAPPRPPDQTPTLAIRYDLFPVKIDQPIDSEQFAVEPPKGMGKVERFEQSDLGDARAPDVGELAAMLVGKPSPLVQGTDFLGSGFDMKELDDHLTLLFLWSPHGGLDCLSGISMVQRLTEQFKANPQVAVLGISGEAEEPDAVNALLQAKGAEFRNLLDNDKETMRSFSVEGLPLYFLIAGDRTITHAWYGSPPEREQEVAQAIRALLEARAHPPGN